MKVTPLEIRQKQFEKKTFGGIDKDEVQAYLNSLSIAWEKMLEEQASLKTAEDTSQKAIDQANQQAQLIVQEARLKADTLHQEAKWKASKAMEQAEEYSKKSYDKMVQDVKILERDLRAIENLKDNFLSDIKIIAQDLLEKADKANQRSANIQFNVPPPPQIDLARPFMEAKEVEAVIETLDIPETQQTIGFEPEPAVQKPVQEPAFTSEPPAKSETKKSAPVKETNGEGSFFDQI
jgi:cell division initiation protein